MTYALLALGFVITALLAYVAFQALRIWRSYLEYNARLVIIHQGLSKILERLQQSIALLHRTFPGGLHDHSHRGERERSDRRSNQGGHGGGAAS